MHLQTPAGRTCPGELQPVPTGRVERRRAEASRAEPRRAEPSRVEPSRVERRRDETRRDETICVAAMRPAVREPARRPRSGAIGRGTSGTRAGLAVLVACALRASLRRRRHGRTDGWDAASGRSRWLGARAARSGGARAREVSASDRTFGKQVPRTVGGLADGSTRVKTVRTGAYMYGSVLTSTRSALAMLCWGARKCDFLNFQNVLQLIIHDCTESSHILGSLIAHHSETAAEIAEIR